MNFRPRPQEEIDVNLTPLIDVVFLLLIFFMVTTTFDQDAAIKVALPTADNASASSQKNAIELVVDSQGRYYIDGREVLNNKPETLFQAMRHVLDQQDQVPPLVISADANANYQAVVTAMDIAGRLGMTNFSMATTQTERQK
ncbi:MAG: ExbD/TolR family protein [bacterium]